VHKAAGVKTFVGSICKRPGVRKEKRQHFKNYSHVQLVQSAVIIPPGATPADNRQTLTDSINAFVEALRSWKAEATSPPRRTSGDAPAQPYTEAEDAAF
jgi:hypothetical protein